MDNRVPRSSLDVGRLKWFVGIAKQRLRGLQELGFEASGPEFRRGPPDRSVSLRFECRARRRSVVVDLGLGDPRPALVVAVHREPRRSIGDDVVLSVFASRRAGVAESAFYYDLGLRSFEEETERLLVAYAGVLFGSALSILKGDEWEEGMIHSWT